MGRTGEVTHRRGDPDHDVQWMVRLELRPGLVPLACTPAFRLSPGAPPLPAAPEQLLLNGALARSLRLRRRHDPRIIMNRQHVN
jgi:hypothetical protein